MSIHNVWTADRSNARSNSYESRCAACGETVPEKDGALVSTAMTSGAANQNRALHPSCELPAGYYFRARMGVGVSLVDAQLGRTAQAEQTVPDEPAAPTPPSESELEAAARKLLADNTAEFLRLVPDLVKSTMHDATRRVEITIPKQPKIKVDTAHRLLPTIIMALVANTSPLLVGPAGSGKSTLCEQAAKIAGKKFYMANSVAGKHELLGFRDATGQPVHTDFYKAYKSGGLFLLDEMDNSNPNALVALNAAISNGFCDFAGELVRAHKDFQMIASANTFGRGADSMYVGRNKLDAATLDRFQVYIMDYDEELERTLAGDDEWVKWVQAVRAVIYSEKIQHVVSPRASINGARLLAAGMERSVVEESCVWKGLDNNHRARIVARMGAVA